MEGVAGNIKPRSLLGHRIICKIYIENCNYILPVRDYNYLHKYAGSIVFLLNQKYEISRYSWTKV
jgi:hypothetical protein